MVGGRCGGLLPLMLVLAMAATTASKSADNANAEVISTAAAIVVQTDKVTEANDAEETDAQSGDSGTSISDIEHEKEHLGSISSDVSKLQEENPEDRVVMPEKMTGPTVPQIAQARRLMLGEGDEGDASPSSLQAPDSSMEPSSAEGSRDSFLFRLTNKSFLDTFSQMRKTIGHEDTHNITNPPATSEMLFITPASRTTTPSSVEVDRTPYVNNSTVVGDSNDVISAEDDMLIQDTRLLLSEMLAKKTGLAYNHSFLDDLDHSDSDYPLLQESQLVETRLPAPAAPCLPGSGRCRSLRERLLEDLVTSYNEPFPARIRYRLKKKPSVYTTKKPRTRYDIGVPDIYETEVDVTSQEDGHQASYPRPRLPTHDHKVAADSGRLRVVAPKRKRPLQSHGAIHAKRRDQKLASAQKATKTRSRTSIKPSNGRRRTGSSRVRNPPSLRGYMRPRKVYSKTHLDYRRPVSFKFKRMNHLKESKKSGHHKDSSSAEDGKSKEDKYDSKEKGGPLRSAHMNSFVASKEHSQLSHHPRAQLGRIRNGQKLRKRPAKRRRKNKNRLQQSKVGNSYGPPNTESGYTSPKPPSTYETALKSPTHYGASKEKVEPYEAVSATTSTSVFYKQSIHDYKPHTVTSHPAHPPSDYLPPKPSHPIPHHLPPGHAGTKSATVPDWLMDLKSKPKHPTPPRKFHPTSEERSQKFPSSSPRPSDYALKASKPSSLHPGYPTHSTPQSKYEPPKPEPEPTYKAPKESYKEPKVEYTIPGKVSPGSSYSANKPHPDASKPHVPNHFQIIKPPLTNPISSYRAPPPPHLHIPLEPEHLPPSKEYKAPWHGKASKPSEAIPHYPVIPSPDGHEGSKYSVKVSTPSGIYITPVKVNPKPEYKPPQTLLPIYAPPISPRPTYGPPTPAQHPASISGKPLHLTASYQTPPTVPHDPHPHKVHVGKPELGVTAKTVLKISSQPALKYAPPKPDYIPPHSTPKYSPPKSDYSPPQSTPKYSPPKPDYIPPQSTPKYSPPKSDYSPPQSTPKYSPPKPAYIPPKSTPKYSPPKSDYSPPQSTPKYSPPKPAYIPPQSTPKYSPPKSDYSPPQSTPKHSPPKPDYIPPQSTPKYSPPKPDYIPPQSTPKYSQPKPDYLAPELKVAAKKLTAVPHIPPPRPHQSKSSEYLPPHLSAGVHVTTFKPHVPKSDILKLKEFSYPTGGQISQRPHLKTNTYTPPVYTPKSVGLPGFGSEDHSLTSLTASSALGVLPSHAALQYFLDDDYYYYDDYYYDDDYYDYYDDYYYYDYDDYYDFDYYPEITEAAESRPPIPHHLIPKSNYDIPDNQIQDFGYIAGVPGRAGRDYPILSYIPHTSFGCGLVADYPGYYADMEAGCQVFHVCHHDGRQDSFLCPNGTVFNQKYFVCDWWYNFNCEDAPFFYPVNAAIGHPGAALHTNQFERERHLYGSSSNAIRSSRNVQSQAQGPSPRLSQRGGGGRRQGPRSGSASTSNRYVTTVNQVQKFPFPSSPRIRRFPAPGPSNASQPTQTRRRLTPTGINSPNSPHRLTTLVAEDGGNRAQESSIPNRPPTTGHRKRSPSHFQPTPLPRHDSQPSLGSRIRRKHAYS